uniref:F-box protein 34 n=1 Tax=Poecilia formosa TaxID=48698 RepID=A0A096MI56_POEFO
MHLRSYPKLLCSEVHLDAVRVQTSSQRSAYFGSHQETLMMKMSSNQSNISTSRIPLSFISTNTLCYSTGGSSHLKALRGTTGQQLSCQTDGRCSAPLGPCRSATEEADTVPNVWTVIKPGHVREKIAIFASEACANGSTPLGPLRAVKAKGSWEENRSAKRRRRCLSNQNHQLDQRSHILTEPEPRCSEGPGGQHGEAPEPASGPSPTEEEQKISVVEMVAFLEQRVSELQPNLKPLLSLQRSSTTITLSRNPRPEIKEGDEPDIVRVSEMVAKLESKCPRSSETSLSRSNSLKRTVGRVLLTAGQKSFSSCWTQPQPQPSSGPPETLTAVRVELPVQVKPAVRVESPAWVLPPTPAAPSQEVSGEMAGLWSAEQEPLPGLLFRSSDETGPTLCTPHYRTTFYLEPALPPVSVPQRSEKNKVHKTMGCPSCSAAVPLGRSASVSQDFLRVRQRLQQLLAPQSYLLLLPHHLLVNLLLLLPTQSLAALKCTCSYFKFVIENYSVRPADSLWVSDPRYRDDPCKQCKKRYRPGDVSLCRWHHKPYCQALPYGPGYWMCCHGAQRDAPGCNVGLHDNRWVPAFHSINVPIYRRNYHYESDL